VPTSTPFPNVSTVDEAMRLFDYDATASLNIVEQNAPRDENGIMLYDLTFDWPDGRRISAYLLVPPGEGPFPAIVYAHWLGETNNNRNEFLEEALHMAGEGYVSVLLDQTFPWKQKPKSISRDLPAIIKQVISIRRCVDLLMSGSYVQVDPGEIAFVGHDYGAMYGSIAVAVDDRFSGAVLMTPTTRFANWNTVFWQLDDTASDYKTALQYFDPVEYLPLYRSIPVLLQFSTRDAYVSTDIAAEFADAFSVSKTVKQYDAVHQLDENAREDRIKWLLDMFKK